MLLLKQIKQKNLEGVSDLLVLVLLRVPRNGGRQILLKERVAFETQCVDNPLCESNLAIVVDKYILPRRVRQFLLDVLHPLDRPSISRTGHQRLSMDV